MVYTPSTCPQLQAGHDNLLRVSHQWYYYCYHYYYYIRLPYYCYGDFYITLITSISKNAMTVGFSITIITIINVTTILHKLTSLPSKSLPKKKP